MSNLKGEMIFSLRPDYNQDVDNARHSIPEIEYKFGFDQSNGLQLTVDEIHFHFNKFLRSLGYQVPLTKFEEFVDEEFKFDEGDDSDGQ